MTDVLQEEVPLPCGAVLPNRICKAPLTEGLADELNRPTAELCELYRQWSLGGSGLLITGNVMVDRRYVERPGNVAIDGKQTEEQLEKLRAYARAGTLWGNHCWVQLSHAGRQCCVKVSKVGVAPSPIRSKSIYGVIPSYTPRALAPGEIEDVVSRFAHAARTCKACGFTGVQVHGAHGYLLSSFLNPGANKRSDEYGGSVENRARALLSVVVAVREAVGPEFPVSVKLNSADFSKNGFTHEDSMKVAQMLEAASVDLLEISGGNYENPAMLGGDDLRNQTAVREAYFLKYAEGIQKNTSRMVLCLTGGMRSRAVMEKAVKESSIQVIGVGRPLCGMPDATKRLFNREISSFPSYENDLDLPWALRVFKKLQPFKVLRHFLLQMWYYGQLISIGLGKGSASTGTQLSPWAAYWYVDGRDNRQARNLKNLDCKGTILNSSWLPFA